MGNRFKEGQELNSVYYNDAQDGYTVGFPIGYSQVLSITVVMENGQMAGVPWALIKRIGRPDTKINLALCLMTEAEDAPNA